jgi:hypothetical protein|nr:ERF family protein [uncultured Schaedlerella sp.]
MKSYNHLNLQQKLWKVRKRIPALVKKRYSEDVDYEFIRIDDIHKFLTPALNKYGVNFEILEETPTKRDVNGNPIYLVQENGCWIYESDLLVGWVNADRPEEQETACIHAVGTHEMPEKSKGTAWTYAIKHYLSNRFSINQGGEDADFHDYSTVPMETDPEKQKEKSKKGYSEPGKQRKRKAASGDSKGQIEGAVREKRLQGASETKQEIRFPSLDETYPKNPARSAAGQPEDRGRKVQEMNPVETCHEEKTLAVQNPGTEHTEKNPETADKEVQIQNIAEQKKEDKTTRKGDFIKNGQKTAEETDVVKGQISFESMLQESEGIATEAGAEESVGTADTAEDGFVEIPPDEEIPFTEDNVNEKEDDFFQALMEDMGEKEEPSPDGMTVEEARKVECTMGLFMGKPLGEAMDAGESGRKALEWIAKRYSGDNIALKEAAKLLLDVMDSSDRQKAA